MEINATQQQTIREYLLGRLPREQQAQFEERLLTDDEFYEELAIVEDELVDDYLRCELTAKDRESFESHFVSVPEHQEKLNFARAFSKYVTAKSEAQEPAAAAESTAADASTQTRADRTRSRKLWFGFLPLRNPAWGYAMSAILAVMLLGVAWVVWGSLLAPRDPGRVFAVALPPGGLSRGGDEEVKRIVVQADTDTLRLQLLVPDNRYQSYEATLDSDGRLLTTKTNLKSESVNGEPAVILDVEASLVPTGDYRVKLSGVTANGNTESVATYLLPIQSR